MCYNNKPCDKLELCGLEVSCIIGELPYERITEQTLVINVVLSMDLHPAAKSDKLSDTLDYAELCGEIRSVLRSAKCRMIERAAECVAFVSLRDSRVQSVKVRVEKKESVSGLRAAAVTIERDEIEGYE